ncbi:iron complex outermembrane recepter protein [Polaribacter sp. KT25b]|uniref:TonB-dependent receptor n=1 Tax=Polaribacter sp. KT25b TaxID=1855336 RepID=UPI00087A6CBE|nr:TonB-dependent receptor [Polaribacter sp. KT25b]SDS43306.1 iron complex outermembrane recepter protein [Polaribacter sp. KT25b]
MFASILANAQTFTLKGKVVDENNESLPGATILVKENNQGTSTDFNGKFQLNLIKGEYTIKVSFIGYKTITKEISLVKNDEIEIVLLPNSTVLEEVLVSAVRVKADAPVTHSNLSKKEIAKRNLGQDIPVLLNYMPSVISSSDAGAGVGYTYIRVRGSDASRVNVTVNGIPYNDAESQGTFWVNMGDFASSTQSLQLQRGVGTSTNGSGAFGASLNILTDAISEEAGGEISNSFGSYGTRKHTVKFTTGKVNDHFEFAGRLSNIYSDGYVDRAFADLKSYFLQGSYSDENTLIKALAFGGSEKTYQAWYGLEADQLEENRRQNPYTYDNETDNYWQDHYQLHWNEKLNDNWSTNIGLNYTSGKGYFEQFKGESAVSKYNNIVSPTTVTWDEKPATDVIVRRWLDNHFYVFNGNTTYKKEQLEIVSGFSYSNYKGDHFGEVIWAKEFAPTANIRDQYYFSDASKKDFSVFSKATFNISDEFKAFVDLQGRFVNYKTDGLTSDRNTLNVEEKFNFFNPKIGLTHTINKNNSLYISYAKANKEPNRNDYKNGEDVKYESLNDYELGWRLKNNTIQLNTNLYYMSYNNQLIQTGGLNDVGDYLRENVKDSYRLGLEIDANVKVSGQFSINQNLTLSSNKINNFMLDRDGTITNIGTTNIAFSPDVIASNALVYYPTENFQVSLLSKFVGEQYLSNTDTEASKLDSYFTSDLNFVYEIKTSSIFKSITFTGVVNNIFNKEYEDRGYTYLDYWSGPTSFEVQGYFPQATRNFLVGVTMKF